MGKMGKEFEIEILISTAIGIWGLGKMEAKACRTLKPNR